MRRLSLLTLAMCGMAATILAQGPLTNALNLRVKADSNGALIVTVGAAGTQGPATNLGNLMLRTDSNGALQVAVGSGGSIPLTGGGTFSTTDGTTTATLFANHLSMGTGVEVSDAVWRGANRVFNMVAANGISWSSTSSISGTADLGLARNAAGRLEVNTGTIGTIGDVVVRRLSGSQTTAPTCSSNCGTSPSVTGSDTAMLITMGATGVPASGWVVTFNGTWGAAPSCIALSAKTGMVAGKAPIVVVTTTTTATVTTNGTAPANSDVYAMHCLGVQ